MASRVQKKEATGGNGVSLEDFTGKFFCTPSLLATGAVIDAEEGLLLRQHSSNRGF
jgi:hypothetical protein